MLSCKQLLICLALISACSFSACRKTPAPAGQTPTSPPVINQQYQYPQGGITPASDPKYFKGSIGSTLGLQMKLVREGDRLSGTYFYQKVGTRIEVRGTIDKDGNVVIEEFDPKGAKTGVFTGLWKLDADGLIEIAGNWNKPDSDKKTAFSVHEEPIAFTGDVDLAPKQIKENNKKLMYEIDARYPQLAGGSNPNFEKFNQVARGFVAKKVAEFKKDMAPEEDEEPRPEGSMGSDLNVSYEVALAQDDLISISYSVGSYYQGAAHPNTFSEVVNYDLKNGRQLKLADLFKPGAKYLQAIANYCIADLKKQAKDKGLLEDEIQNGAAANAKNYRSWTITRKGLGINFDAYQVGPYAAGPQYVLVPYSSLKELINPEGPVGQFAK